ncbi:glycosyltransferase [Pedobacter heparinus]|uniref:glycosyltransferase n=1 Tax=Pedobacter heparinus TaxID=984 RepID=UPI00292CD945|nr:glycosyltransferase [Pedobacter heparinus]
MLQEHFKVAHISTYQGGGAGLAAYRLHNSLLKANINSKFLSGHQTGTSKDRELIESIQWKLFYRILSKLGIPILNVHKNNRKVAQLNGKFEKISFPDQDNRIETLETLNNADIINLHWVSDLINYKTFFKQFKDKPIVWTLHDMAPFQGIFHYKNDLLNNNAYIKIEQREVANKIKYLAGLENLHIVTPSKWLLSESENSELFKRFPHHLIPYGQPLNDFRMLDKIMAKNALGLEPNMPTLIFVAENLSNIRKGVQILMDAIHSLPENSVQILTIGNHPIIFANQPHRNLGFISNEQIISLAYSAADLCILPSLEDNLPNVMLESFACGTPVLSFKVGGMLDWIDGEKMGFFADEINSKSLREAILDFVTGKRSFDSWEIRKLAEENFDEKIQSTRYISLYNSIL